MPLLRSAEVLSDGLLDYQSTRAAAALSSGRQLDLTAMPYGIHVKEPSPPSLLRGMIFDLDGTLADTLPVCFAAFREVFRNYLGIDYSDQQVRAMFGPSEAGILKSRIPERSEEALADYLSAYERHHRMCPEPFPGIREILERLGRHGVRLAVVTGKGEGSASISLRVLGLENLFEPVKAGAEGGGVKPDAMRQVLAAWGFPPAEVASIGDARPDVDSAKQVGLVPLAAAWARTADFDLLASRKPVAVFREVAEFAAWVDEHLGSLLSG